MKNNIKELGMIVGLVVILGFLLNPMGFYYSNMTLASSITLLIIFFIFISIFIWREVPQDEREEKHQSSAGKMAFFFGTGTMLLGIVVQSLSHSIDVWLVVSLAVMVISRFVVVKYRNWVD